MSYFPPDDWKAKFRSDYQDLFKHEPKPEDILAAWAEERKAKLEAEERKAKLEAEERERERKARLEEMKLKMEAEIRLKELELKQQGVIESKEEKKTASVAAATPGPSATSSSLSSSSAGMHQCTTGAPASSSSSSSSGSVATSLPSASSTSSSSSATAAAASLLVPETKESKEEKSLGSPPPDIPDAASFCDPKMLLHPVPVNRDDEQFIWQPARANINTNNHVIVTSAMQGFLGHLIRRFRKWMSASTVAAFTSPSSAASASSASFSSFSSSSSSSVTSSSTPEDWDSLVVRGLSGSGKSVAIAVGSAVLKALLPANCQVYWVRETIEFPLSRWTDFIRTRTPSDPPCVLCGDQLELGSLAECMVSLGNSNRSVFAIVGGSGNFHPAQLNSSSYTRIIREYEYEPQLRVDEFHAMWAEAKGASPLKALSFQEQLQFTPTALCDFYQGAQGHALSVMALRELTRSNPKLTVQEVWQRRILELQSQLAAFFHKAGKENSEQVMKYYCALHNAIFRQGASTFSNADARFISGESIFSSLFVQAYRHLLLTQKLFEPPWFATNLCFAQDNPSVLGFFLERCVLTACDDKLLRLAFQCIEFGKLLPANKIKPEECKRETFSFDPAMELPACVRVGETSVFGLHLTPVHWNEEAVDYVQLYECDHTAVLLGVSISLQTTVAHIKSVSWFTMIKPLMHKLRARGFTSIHVLLLMVGSQGSSSEVGVSEEDFDDSLSINVVFDYPLTRVLPDAVRLQFATQLSSVQAFTDRPRPLTLKKRENKKRKHASACGCKAGCVKKCCSCYADDRACSDDCTCEGCRNPKPVRP